MNCFDSNPFEPKSKNRTLPPNLTRRPHRKSRNGCHRCKRRRIKCDEGRPSCYNCAARLIICTYPQPAYQTDNDHRQQSYVSSFTAAEYPLHTVAKPFSWADVRALHHFLVFCPPSLPFGNRDVWTGHVPQIAHQRPFLMQGILAFSSSHLSRLKRSPELEQQALLHRGRAITGIKNHVQTIASWSALDIDAAIATSYVLALQAIHIPDGMGDYLAFVSGCGSLVQHVVSRNLSSGFKLGNRRSIAQYSADITGLLAHETELSLIEEACEIFASFEPYVTDLADLEFFTAVKVMLRSFDNGASTGLLAALNMSSLWHYLVGAYLEVFLKPDCTVSRILLIYFLSVQTILWGLLPFQWWPLSFRQLPPGQPFVELLQWITALMHSIPIKLEERLAWPRSIICQFFKVLENSCEASGIALDPSIKETYARNIQRNAHIVLGDILRVCADINTWYEELLKKVIEKASQEGHTTTNENNTTTAIVANTS